MCNAYSQPVWDILIYILIRYWMVRSLCPSVCPFAIETTFPLSNFKTKHIFGILMTLRTFLKLWAPQATPKTGARGARNMGRPRRANFFFFLLPPPKAAPRALLPRRAREIPPKVVVSRVYNKIIISQNAK